MTTLDAAAILRARARELARPLEAGGPAEMLEILEFRLGGERYAVETRHVREVCVLKELTALPSTPAFVRGIVNVRGRIVAVLDLSELLDLERTGLTDLHRIILLEGNGLEPGLLADSVVGVRSIPAASLQPSLPTLTGIRAAFLRGVTPEHLVVLDVDRILAEPGIIVDQQTDESPS